MAEKRGHVSLVGAGPGDPGLLTMKAARLIAHADVLVYDYLASSAIVGMAPPDCEKIYVGKKAGAHTLTQDEITALIVKLGLDGRRVVRLKGGDVFVFARGGEEAQALRAAGVAFDIVPGLTSAIAAPAYAGIPVTHRDHNTSFTIATGHEDPTKGYTSLDFAKLANPKQTLLFLMAMGSLAGIVEQLVKHGMPAEMPVAIVREGTKPTQETLVGTLATIVAEVERTSFKAPAIVVIGDVVRERETIRWFDNGALFGKRVLVTRPVAQADDMATRLWEAGAEPLLAPTIAIEPIADAAFARAVDDLAVYTWIAFTSRNGVDAFFDRLTALGRDARALGMVRVAAVGPKTAEALGRRGIRADLVPGTFAGSDVAAGILAETAPGDRVAFFRAQEAADDTIAALRDAGRDVDDVAAYRTVTVHDPLIAEQLAQADVVTFASGSAVDGLLANVPDGVRALAEKLVACIGPVTADAARAHGIRVDVVAAEATVASLLEALDTTLAPA
jgi:uroporphyrinogen III methyltransferase/synthase